MSIQSSHTSISHNHESSLRYYMQKIRQYKMLSAEEEKSLAMRWQFHQDREAAEILVLSHLRLVVKVAYQFKGYGITISDLIAEGNIGLMHAVKKFDINKGFRLTTYAVWWIRAYISEYILKTWSVVKIGTSTARKKLFFSLTGIKRKLGIIDNQLTQSELKQIAQQQQVSTRDVEDINLLLTGQDISLATPVGSLDNKSMEYGETIPDATQNPEEYATSQAEKTQTKKILSLALKQLTEREQEIIKARFTTKKSLEKIGEIYGVSRERVRQIEHAALKKMKGFMTTHGIQMP